jgi:ABC-type dipeptide/oligopeptide/nickel transport system permease component
MIVTLLIAVIVIFSLVRMVPGDPVLAVIGDSQYTPEQYAATKHRLGLDEPYYRQLLNYAARLVRLDLGVSFHNDRPVLTNVTEQLPYTAQLALLSLFFAVLFGLPLGICAALFHGTWFEQGTMFMALVALSLPNFLLGLILILLLSGRLGWFPSFGTGSASNPVDLLHHALLPALVLGASSSGVLARMTRSSLLEVMSKDYIRTARAKGLAPHTIIVRHALRNAFVPVLTVIGMDLARLLTGTMIIETLFARLGVGKTLIDAILFRDYSQIQGTLLVFVVIVICVNTLTDIAYTVVDPRIRMA